MQRAFPHDFQHAFQHAVQHGLQRALQHFPQFSTMFVRASFACGKALQGNGIRRRRRARAIGQMVELLKNVEIHRQRQPLLLNIQLPTLPAGNRNREEEPVAPDPATATMPAT